jgi:hypothetical protein
MSNTGTKVETRTTARVGSKPPTAPTASDSLQQLSDLGPRGLVMYHEKKFYYATEEEWRATKVDAAGAKYLQGLKAVAAVLASNEIFVNFDQLAELARTKLTDTGSGDVSLEGLATPAVVVREGDNHFAVTGWRPLVQPGDAGVLVTRGATVAVIPQNTIPSGTYCVLINFHAFTG